MSSILTLQRRAIAALIDSMTIAGGYNNDWNTINNRNYSIGPFPRAEIYSVEERNMDTLAGIGSGDYTNEVDWEIHIINKMQTSATNPIFDIQDLEDAMIDDMKRLFGAIDNRSVSGTVDSFLYKGFRREIVSTDQFTPRKIITKWTSTYSQDRVDPTQYASS